MSETRQHAASPSPPARQLPDWPLPSYAFVPGKFRHPRRDAKPSDNPLPDFENETHVLEDWRECTAYLYGIDLFNLGYYWEAHEAWEALWHATGRKGPLAEFLKGLIALAAVGVKARQNRRNGVLDHSRRAYNFLTHLRDECHPPRNHFFGLELGPLIDAASTIAAEPDRFITTSDAAVIRILPFTLNVIPHEEV